MAPLRERSEAPLRLRELEPGAGYWCSEPRLSEPLRPALAGFLTLSTDADTALTQILVILWFRLSFASAESFRNYLNVELTQTEKATILGASL
jgi:hypothetical protein